MNLVLALVTGAIFAASLYLLLRRNMVKMIIGLALLSHGTNLLIFTASGLVRGRPPVLDAGKPPSEAIIADPVPQALILTAIVISFGLLAFTLVLIHRTSEELGTDDVDKLRGPIE